ncbi:uncharacterized protein LOC110992827 [Pieris rapae]|uniref:uncharacterized protein LOC110992827 n=1 Tax=Pieris rapae TaxID=64459 RepID=UPI001E27F3BA|nr:uncharacterized protein LOC110992827 [Pieris rapae]
MLRTTFSKIKRVCSVALIPRIFQEDVKYAAQKKFTKHSMITSHATKTTSSNSGATDNNNFHGGDKKPEDNVQKSTENLAEDREKCDRVISKIFPPGDPLYATPTDKEVLEQKIEHIKEVEDGVPITFKEQKESDATNLYYDSEPNNYDTRYDGIADKCLQTPPKKVDEQLLRELGVDHIPENIDFYPQRPKQSYYSEVLYGKPQVVRYTNETPKTNELQKVNSLSDLEVDRSFKAELIQPLIFDSISLCESVGKGSEADNFDALEDTQLTPVILNPYASQSFPFHDYAIKDILLENTVEEESMTVTTGIDDVSNNNLIPPNEMDIESDERNVREKVEGAISGLAIPGESTSIETQPITTMVEKEFDILYTQPTSGPPDGPGTLHRQPEKVVKQSTSISSKSKEEKPPNTKNTSISDNQDPNDSDNINRISGVHERPDFLLNMQANVFADNASITEDLKEPIFARKTIVSYIEGSYKKPIIEIKIPVYNKKTEQSIEEATVHFKETDDNSVEQNTASYVREHSNVSASCGRGPAKTPKMQKYSNLERTVSHIEVTEKMPITENTPVLNVRLKPEYEGLLKDKKGVHQTEAANCNLDPNLTATGPIPNMVEKETVTLKELLRRIRERHRLELCREYYNRLTNMNMTEACSKPGTLGPNPCKGKDKSPCPPPPKCPSTTKKDPCAAKDDPCAPKKKDPCAPKKKDPCQQKDPCAKFLNSKIYDTLSLFRIYILPDFRNVNFQYRQYSSQVLSTRALQIRALNTPVLNVGTDTVKDVVLARDYEPWVPIPSWPIPKKEKRRPFVCPKDGCKLLPSPPFDPAFKDKPCVSFPKKKFSLSELFEHPVVTSKDS